MAILSLLEEKTVGKGENAGNHHYFLFLQCFQIHSPSGSLEVGLYGKE